MGYTIEQIETIAAKLRELPPIEKKKREVNKQSAIVLLAKEITALQKRGYTLDQIAETLRGEGLEITTPILKNALQRAKPKKKTDTPPPPARPKEIGGPASGATLPPNSGSFIPRPDRDKL